MARTSKAAAGKTSTRRTVIPRGRALVALAVVGLLGWSGFELWRHVSPVVAQRQRFLLTADRTKLNEPPVWIVGDVREVIVRDAGVVGRLSLLDDRFIDKVRAAFSLNPWIESVDRIEKLVPAGVDVQVTYRRPVAVVELPDAGGRRLAPVDRRATHLPEQDVPENRRHWLPRIVGIVGEPPLGQPWDDPRVAGALELAMRLESQWDSFYLSEIVPSARARIHDAHKYFEYELVTRGGTRVVWGAAPSADAPGEDPFEAKLQRLEEAIKRKGPFNTVHGPKTVNVRDGLQITERSARKPPSPKQPETTMR